MNFLQPNDALGRLVIEETFLYFDGPRLFVAENAAGQKFLINCLDSDDLQDYWLSSAISERRLFALKDGVLPLREAFSVPELGYVIRFSTTRDGVLRQHQIIQPNELHADDLPDPEVFLRGELVERTTTDAVFLAKRLNTDVVLLHLYPGLKIFEASVRAVGKVLSSFEDYLSSKISRLQAGTENASTAFQVNMLGTFAGSFGLELSVRGGDPRIGTIVKDAVDDLSFAADPHELEEKMAGVRDEEVASLKKFLSEIKRAGSDLKIEAASRTDTEAISVEVSLPKVRAAIKSLKREPSVGKTTKTLVAELVGINLRSRRFEIFDVESRETFTGAIDAVIFQELRVIELPRRYRVVIEADIRRTTSGSEEPSAWRMISATMLA